MPSVPGQKILSPKLKGVIRVLFALSIFSLHFPALPAPAIRGGGASLPDQITRLKDLNLTTILCENQRPQATIVVPEHEDYRALASEINARIRQCGGAGLPVAVNKRPSDLLPNGHVIALGNLTNNPFIEKLYFQWFCFTDRWYPGEGGYEVRSIHNPYGTRTNVILLGGSDQRGVAEAVGRFCGLLNPRNPLSVGWLLDVRLGKNLLPPADKDRTPPLLRLFVDGLEMPLGYNEVSRLGLTYYYTGDGRYAREFLASALRSDLLARAGHYYAHHNALVWDLIEESPLFTAEDRLSISNRLLEHARGSESGGGLEVLLSSPGQLFDRHAGFIGLCALCEARYFARDYPSPEWSKILAAVDKYFTPHLDSFASGSDLARGIYTYLEALLIYSLLSGNDEIVRSGALRFWADRCVALCDPQGFLVPSGQYDETSYPYFTLRKASHLLRDPGLLYVAEMRRRAGESQGVYQLGMEYDQGQAFAGDLEPRPPRDIAGVHVVPLDSRERRVFGPALPQQKSFSKITFRTGFGENDQFLLLDGIWGGPPGKPIQDAGAILQFSDGGRTFLVGVDPETQNRRSSHVNHNVLSVTLNGEAPEPPRLAALEAVADLPSIGLTHIRLDPYMNGTWDRYVFWRKGSYFLVRDIFRAAREGVFSLESQWRLLGRVEKREDGFTATADGSAPTRPGQHDPGERTLVVRAIGDSAGPPGRSPWPVRQGEIDISGETVSRQYARYAPPAIQRLRPTSVVRLRQGEDEAICALFYTTSKERARQNSIAALGKGLYLIAGDEPAWVGFPGDAGTFARGPLAVKARGFWATAAVAAADGMTHLEIGGQVLLSAVKPVDAEWDFASRTCTLRLSESTFVGVSGSSRAELEPGEHHFSGLPAVAGETLESLAQALAQDAAASRPESKPPVDEPLRPALMAPRLPPAGEVLSGSVILDLDISKSDDNAVVLAGCADGRVIRMDGSGRIIWEFRTGGPVHVVEIAELTAGRWAALAGSDDECLYALELAEGEKIWSHRAEVFPETHIYPWWTLGGKAKVRSILAADFDGDGRVEIAIGTGGMQVEMLGSDGSLRWRHPVKYGLPIRLLSLQPSSGGPVRLLAGLDFLASQSNIFSFRPGGAMESDDAFPSGREGWDYTGVSAMAAAETKDGRTVLAVARSGAYNEVGFYEAATGRALGKARLGDATSGLTWLSVNSEPAALAATEAGWVIVLRPDGNVIWSVPLPDSVTRFWPAARGRTVAYCRSGDYFVLDSSGSVLSRGHGSWPAAMLQTALD